MFLQVKNLTKKFRDGLAVNNISFNIEKNTTVGLLGPNGCGKTTSIGMILGLIKPSAGEIIIDNKNLEKIKRDDILSKINFASPYVELPKKLTVRQNLEIFGRLYGVKNLDYRINEISEELDLKKFLKRKTGELSSGQKNRVSLAKAFINDPEILLLDEPTASLDPDVGDYVRGIIENFSSNKQKTILIASHNMDEVERLCDEVMMMKNGEIIDKGKSSDLVNKHGRKNLEEVFLKIVREIK